MKALVLDGDSRSALAIVRSLGRHGIHVIVASDDKRSLAGSSRYCSERIVYPSPASTPTLFREWLISTLASMPDVVLYTSSDVTTSIAGQCRLSLPPAARMLLPPQLSLETALNKAATLDLARRLNVPVPGSVEFRRGQPVDVDAIEFPYPVAVKAAQSDLACRAVTSYAVNSDRLRTVIASLHRTCDSVLVQERLPGEGTGIFALFDSSRPVITFAHRRKREKPPWGGVSVLSESIEEPQDTLRYSLAILKELKWHGAAMVEFKRSANGIPCLLEINPRFWGSLELAIRSGLDFPYIAYRFAVGDKIETQRDYRQVMNRWVLGEIDSIFKSLTTRTWPDGTYHSPLWALLSYIWDWHYGPCCEVERFNDPSPALYEYTEWFRTSTSRLMRRIPSPLAGEG